MGAAIVRPPNTKYTQSIGVCLEKLPKFNYVFGYGNFFHSMIFTMFLKYLPTEKNSYRRKLS